MALREKSRFWRKCRIFLRRFRFFVLLLVLAFLAALLYLNQVGLPGFVKRPLLNTLRARGIELQFSRLRWRWDRGLVAENVRFGPTTNRPFGPQLTAKTVQLNLKKSSLLKLQFQFTGLGLRDGRLAWSVAGTNEAPRELAVEGIQTELRLLPGDLWELDDFQAQFAGANVQLTGSVTNASAVRDWKIFQGRPVQPGTLEARLRQLADRLEQIRFAAPPQLKADVRGDARAPSSFAFRLTLDSPECETAWGYLQHGHLSVLLRPATSNATSHAEINLQADHTRTRWGNATNLTLKLNLLSTGPNLDSVNAVLDVDVAGVDTEWGGAATAHGNVEWLHAISNAVPISGRGEWQAEAVKTRWGDVRQLHCISTLATPRMPVAWNESWGWWTNLAPFSLYWECLARGLESPKFKAEEIFCSGDWIAPRLTVERISGELYNGKLNADAGLNVATRKFQFTTASDFDIQKLAPLLTEKSSRWLTQFSWKVPPIVKAEGMLTLPAWTNLNDADWRGEVQPTVRLDGEFQGENGSFRNVAFSYALSHFTYSNLTWNVPDLVATRPEGRLDMVYDGDERTHEYRFRVRSTLDPRALRPLFETNQQRAFDLVSFTRPPVVDGELRGRWYDPGSLSATARVAVTNFSFRGEWLGDLQTSVEYSNLVLRVIEPRIQRGTQQMSATMLIADFPANKIYLTNGFGTADPGAVTRAISPKIGKLMEPYQFAQPPTVRVRGVIPLKNYREADLHFDVAGGPFAWWKFKVPRVEGKVDWTGERLKLRNVQPAFYRGTALANVEFDFSADHGADFWFDFSTSDSDLRLLMVDLTGKTNRLEGLLTGRLIVTQANTADWTSWQGGGRLDLRDGLIWAIPIFGILTPALDAIAPGLGSSRAREAAATYLITNGVVRFDDLEIRASMMRLQYRGTVDLQGRVEARVQAELLRDTWVIGRVLSLALWPITKVFEYKLTGTLKEPKSEPVYIIPKILLLPFHPFGGGKSTPESEPDWSKTNSLPARL